MKESSSVDQVFSLLNTAGDGIREFMEETESINTIF